MKTNFKKVLLMISVAIVLMAIPFSVSAMTARWYSYHVLNMWCVDSGKHLDWSGSTIYSSNFNTGVNTWNNYKSGVIRQDGVLTVNDVTICDVTDLSGDTCAMTSMAHDASGGKCTATIQFATAKMNNLSTMQRNITCTHELGHALGLDENNDNGTSVVMFNNMLYNTSNNVLHSEDKFNYDYMYNNKY